jgi:uncharacterized repeat protein (TIGR03803 family)
MTNKMCAPILRPFPPRGANALAILAALWVGLVAVPPSKGQTFTKLADFCSGGVSCPSGGEPWAGLVQGTDGNFYGTTNKLGAYGGGTVFRWAPGSGITPLYSFCSLAGCADGSNPFGGLVQGTDGNFYGTTSAGGAASYCSDGSGCGTVFKITPAGTLTTIYSFCSQIGCADGDYPRGGLVQGTDGNYYGTTAYGGPAADAYLCNSGGGCGTVFKITPTGALTTLYSFAGSDGGNPIAGLIQGSDGNFYGTTYGIGTVFKITPTGTLTTLYIFCSQSGCADGDDPYGALVQGTDGNFYGTTYSGGTTASFGTVFKITPTGALTTLYDFCSQSGCTDGGQPYGGLVQAVDGNFYGTTSYGGANTINGGQTGGTLFKIAPGGTLTTLYSFCSQSGCMDGQSPYGGLVQGSDGNFYGTTSYGGAYVYGTVFSLSVASAPGVTLSSNSLAFGDQVIGTASAAQIVTVTNSGNADLSISGAALGGANASEFFIMSDSCTGADVAPSGTCSVGVSFAPGVAGPASASLDFTDNASSSPQSASLSGTGTDFSVSVTPATQTVKPGKSASYTMSVAPISGFAGTVGLSCSGAPSGGSCALSPTSVTLDGTSAVSATVSVTTSPGKKGTPKGTYTLTLTGSAFTKFPLSHSAAVTLTVQ